MYKPLRSLANPPLPNFSFPGSAVRGCLNYLWATHPFCLHPAVQGPGQGHCSGKQHFLCATGCWGHLNPVSHGGCSSLRPPDCCPLSESTLRNTTWYEKNSCDGGPTPLEKFWGFCSSKCRKSVPPAFPFYPKEKESAAFLVYLAVPIITVTMWTVRSRGQEYPGISWGWI